METEKEMKNKDGKPFEFNIKFYLKSYMNFVAKMPKSLAKSVQKNDKLSRVRIPTKEEYQTCIDNFIQA